MPALLLEWTFEIGAMGNTTYTAVGPVPSGRLGYTFAAWRVVPVVHEDRLKWSLAESDPACLVGLDNALFASVGEAQSRCLERSRAAVWGSADERADLVNALRACVWVLGGLPGIPAYRAFVEGKTALESHDARPS
jgi:hypothetical protein